MEPRAPSEPAVAPSLGFEQAGQGPDVVLVHGAMTSRADMVLGLLPWLSDRYRVTAFDRPGHGESPEDPMSGSPWRQAAALEAAMDELGLERPIIVGHSFGGSVALALALRSPARITGVVALSPIVLPEFRLEHLLFAPRAMTGIGDALNLVLSAGFDPALLPVLQRAMFWPQEAPKPFAALYPGGRAGGPAWMRAEGRDAAWLAAGLGRTLASAPGGVAPVRILAGDADLVVNNELHGRALAMLQPHTTFTSLPGLGHMIHHFAQGTIVDCVDQVAGRYAAAA